MRPIEEPNAASDGGETESAPGGPAAPAARPSRRGLFALAFGSGFAVLTIEIAGARLIAPTFGLSAVPWTAVIGVILGALAVGSHLGGRWADEGRVSLAAVLVTAGLTCALPIAGAGVPWLTLQALGFIPGAVVSALLLFAPPVLCLGAVVPFLVQADTESLGTVGRRAGDVSAMATAGSIVGSFATGFVLLPAFPLPVLLGLTAAALMTMAVYARNLLGGVASTRKVVSGGVGIGLLAAIASGSPADTLHREQTVYSAIAVTERTWADGRAVRELWQNGGSSSAEYVDSGEPAHLYATASLEILEGVIERSDSVLVLGGAALTLPVALTRRRPEIHVDVVEIDPAVTRLAAEYFEYGRETRPGIAVHHEDGRVFLRASTAAYDLVYLDVFDHLLTVPWTMVTREALSAMAERLDDSGIFAANVLSPLAGPGTAFAEHLLATLEEVFVDVRIYVTAPAIDRAATQNLIVVAGRRSGVLPPTAAFAEAPIGGDGLVLTDAWAPVEYLQAKVFAQGLTWN